MTGESLSRHKLQSQFSRQLFFNLPHYFRKRFVVSFASLQLGTIVKR
jgi:hypothetical protein